MRLTRGKSPVREFRTPGSVRGRPGNWPSYRVSVCPVKPNSLSLRWFFVRILTVNFPAITPGTPITLFIPFSDR